NSPPSRWAAPAGPAGSGASAAEKAKASKGARPDMIGPPATIACADGDRRTPAKSRWRRARRARKRRLWRYGHAFGFVGEAALQRAMRRLSFTAAKWGRRG